MASLADSVRNKVHHTRICICECNRSIKAGVSFH